MRLQVRTTSQSVPIPRQVRPSPEEEEEEEEEEEASGTVPGTAECSRRFHPARLGLKTRDEAPRSSAEIMERSSSSFATADLRKIQVSKSIAAII